MKLEKRVNIHLSMKHDGIIIESSLKSLITPKSPKGDFFNLLIFSSSPLGVRGEDGKNQQVEGFLDCTQQLK